ncbi:MAG: hypothetical protein U0Q16_23305 [Bryobacteraceae bacterium]
MTGLPLRNQIGDGNDKDVVKLFEGSARRIIQITLRNGAVLEKHSAPVPITIQCVAGSGTLVVANQSLGLVPGTLVTLEPDEVHEIRSKPAVSILLTQFVR